MDYKTLFKTYIPTTEQEVIDQRLINEFIDKHDDALLRTNLAAHITSSVMIMNPSKTKILLGYHNIYQSWGWFGGHNDGDEDCLKVALKEAEEETGITHFEVLTEEAIAMDVVYVQNHIKKGKFVSDHLHLNVTFGLIANEDAVLRHNDEEHSGIQWVLIEDYPHLVSEPRMMPIYDKIISKMLSY
jgi:8-oxo-dGTP pyrophosphatase MutT (NUDIX family)